MQGVLAPGGSFLCIITPFVLGLSFLLCKMGITYIIPLLSLQGGGETSVNAVGVQLGM